MSLYNALYKLIKATREKKSIPIVVPTDMDSILLDKVSFIAGGSGGIGMAIAERLLACGSKVILGGTKKEKLDKCILFLKQQNVKYQVEPYIFINDVISELTTEITNIASIFGRLDIFINSAGVHTENLDFWNITSEEYDRIMNINLKGPYFTCLEVAKFMKANRISGHILMISSSRGSEPTWSPYGISKNCLDAMIRGLAKQFINYNITIAGIAPGPTATSLIGISEGDSIYSEETLLKRIAVPEEIATFVPLLVSEAGNMTTGEVIHISGGRGIFDIR